MYVYMWRVRGGSKPPSPPVGGFWAGKPGCKVARNLGFRAATPRCKATRNQGFGFQVSSQPAPGTYI